MHGDFSRPRFVSDRPFTRVTQLQGRIGLEADFNTHALLQHDRDATTRIDVIGESGVPIHGGGFNIFTPPGSTDPATLTIGKGRIYLHGFICELSADTLFTTQPFFPGAALTPPTAANGVTVVYLEVWELHRTGVDAPEILDPALDGRDTSGRVQTVFQVKAENAPAGTGCVIPTTVTTGKGKLSVPKVTPTTAADPCSLDATGGYRGLDNRLYRVEIHTPDIPANPFGPAVPATFKWSRDNGAVEYALKAAPTLASGQVKATLRVPPRDDVLALHKGEWVELLDDVTVYRSEPGPLLKIDTDPIPTADGVELSLAVPAGSTVNLPGVNHPRVRRWDGAAGADAVQPGVLVPLEDDIQIQFDGSDFRPGDYWTFTARANGNVVDELVNADPHGIVRHRTPLGVVSWANGAISGVTDCRKPFPPLTELPTPTTGTAGCCTFTAFDVPSLFDAVKQANDAKGPVRVCVLPGVYELADPLIIRRRGMSGPFTLTGCGQATHITRKSGPAVLVQLAENVVIEKLAVSGNPPIQIESQLDVLAQTTLSTRVTVDSCVLAGGKEKWAITAVGLSLTFTRNDCTGGMFIGSGSAQVRVERNTITGGRYGVGIGNRAVSFLDDSKSPTVTGVQIRENAISGSLFAGVGAPSQLSEADLTPTVLDLDVIDNTVTLCGTKAEGSWPPAGISVGFAAGVRVAGNTVRDCGGGKQHAVGVFVALVGHLEVTGNTVLENGIAAHDEKNGQYQGGIVVLAAVGGQPTGDVPKPFNTLFTLPGVAAARVTGNRVVCPLGPALVVSGIGPAVVSGNTFVARGVGKWPVKDPVKFGLLAEDLFRACMTVVGIVPLRAEKTRTALLKALAGDSRLRFEGNQVTLTVDKFAGEEYAFIRWPVDVSVTNNQLLARTGEVPRRHLVVSHPKPTENGESITARVVGNRVAEVPANREITSLLVEAPEKEPSVVIALNQTTGMTVLQAGGTTDLTAGTPRPFHDGNQLVG